MTRQVTYTVLLGLAASGLSATTAEAGPAGSELDLTLTPVSGAMEGVGAVRAQGNLAKVMGNPAAITQLEGETSFTFGGSWISPDLEATGTVSAPGPGGTLVGIPLDGESQLDDLAAPHAAVVQRLSDKLVAGVGLTGTSGLGSDFRDEFPIPLSLTADLKLFGASATAGYQVTEDLSLGAAFMLGIGSLQVGTVPSTTSSNNFGIGGRFGFTYDLGMISIGAQYKTEIHIDYTDIVLVDRNTLQDFTLDQPREVRGGFATTDAFSEDFLFEVNASWKNYSKAEGYQDFWRNQWRVAVGMQYDLTETWTLRGGWSFNRAISKPADQLGNSIGNINSLFAPGFPDLGLGPEVAPVNPDIIQVTQNTIANGLWQQGASIGFGVQLTDRIRADFNANWSYDGTQESVSPIPGSPQAIRGDGNLLSTGMGLTWDF